MIAYTPTKELYIGEVLRAQIAKEQWQSYAFQPELSYIAKNEPTEIGTAFKFANKAESEILPS